MLLRSPLRTSVDESIGSETSPPGWWLSPGSRSKRRLVTGSQRAVGPALRRLAPYAYLFVIAMLAAGVHIARYTQFSPIDELRHVDYAMRASSFHAPRLGDVLSQDAMREEACRGLDLPWEDQPCNTKKFAPLHFRDLGYQTATAHPPTYYLGAGWFARAAEGLGLSNSFIDPARVFSALLFAAGLMVAFAAGRLAGIRGAPLLAALTFVPVMPAALHASSTVNPDATAILVGAVVMLLGLLWERGRLPLWTLAIAGAVAGGTKFTSLLAVGVMGGVFLVRARPIELTRVLWERRRARRATKVAARIDDGVDVNDRGALPELPDADPSVSPRRPLEYLIGLVVMLGTAFVVSGLWLAFDRMRATIAPIEVPQNQSLAFHSIPPASSVISTTQLFAWLPPWNGYDPVRFTSTYVLDARTLMTYVFAGAVILAALRVARRDTISLFGLCCLVAAMVGAPAFVLLNVGVSKVLVNPEARYGLSMVPFMAAIVASYAKNRIGTTLLWLGSLTSFAVVVGTMLAH